MKLRVVPVLLLTQCLFGVEAPQYGFRILGTTKTSTMEKEMNEAAQEGFVFQSVMGGETAFGGKEVVVVMGREAQSASRKVYRLFAANKTSTLEREMQQAAETGFDYKGQTIFESAFGGREVCIIMERDSSAPVKPNRYRLLATSKTSTMEKELAEAGAQGFSVVGMTVAKTALGGSEVVCILKRDAAE